MKVRKYKLLTERDVNIRLAFISDLHNKKFDKIIKILQESKPDCILLGGDMLDNIYDYEFTKGQYGLEFMKQVAKIATTYYCSGNHELTWWQYKPEEVKDITINPQVLSIIEGYGVNYIDDKIVKFRDNIYIGGLKTYNARYTYAPNVELMDELSSKDGFRILLSHHPELYPRFYFGKYFDLILCGHAHGGQWRFFGRGILAPDQGLLPKYTKGFYGQMLVSTGASNPKKIPRFFNPIEIVLVDISKKQ